MKVKAKSKKAIKARFKVSGTGKLLHRRSGKRHILTKKSSNKKRYLGKDAVLSETQQKIYARLIGV